jgi:hypothetical protein
MYVCMYVCLCVRQVVLLGLVLVRQHSCDVCVRMYVCAVYALTNIQRDMHIQAHTHTHARTQKSPASSDLACASALAANNSDLDVCVICMLGIYVSARENIV